MLYIEVNETGKLFICIRNTDAFHDIVEELKTMRFTFDKDTSAWKGKASLYANLVDSMTALGEPITMTSKSQANLEAYFKTIHKLELPKQRRVFQTKLMSYPPLVGKAPFEKYQQIDIQRALNQNRFLFNWEMGLGKSYATAALIEHLRYYKEIDRCIILTTSIGTYNLKNELCKLGTTITPEEFMVIVSIQDYKYVNRDIFNTEKYPAKIIVMTYDTFKSVCDYYYDEKNKTKKNPHPSRSTDCTSTVLPLDTWFGNFKGALFADESHSIANATTARARLIDSHSDFFNYVYEFTGTFADKYEKQYAQLRLLDRYIVNDLPYTEWLRGFCELGNKHSKWAVNKDGWDYIKLKNLNDLVIKTYAAKRLMDECLDLPPDYEVPPPIIEMSPFHREIYESFSSESVRAMAKKAEAEGKSLSSAVTNAFAFFQIALDNPSVLADTPRFSTAFSEDLQKKILKFDYNKDSTKCGYLDAVIDERIDECKEKGIIWYLHPKTGNSLLERYKKYKPVFISSDTDKSERLAIANAWQENPDSMLLIVGVGVLNTSATLTKARWQFYAERTYDFTVYSQTRGRIHRPSKKDISRTYWALYAKSLDFLQSQNLETKGELVDSLHTKEFLTQEELRAIFNLNGTLKIA